MALKIDIDIPKNSLGYFDIDIDDSGDLLTTEGFDTAIKMSIFCERRASPNEVTVARYRRGWIGNLLSDVVGFEIGSKLWLYDQARLDQNTINGVTDAIKDGLLWFIEDGLLDDVHVAAVKTNDVITVQIDLFRDGSLVDQQFYDAWRATGV